MEGRDIGTAVFPDAEVKIFLDAAPEVRGNRRYRQASPIQHATDRQGASRIAPDVQTAEQHRILEEALLAELKERDHRDRTRAESPLQPAADAEILDSTAMSLDEVLAAAEEIVRSHLTA